MFQKNDIKALPLDRLAVEIRNKTIALAEERLINLKSSIESANKRKLKLFAKDAAEYLHSEAGSDGIEEGVVEAVGLEDPAEAELSNEAKLECRDEARKIVIPSFLEAFDIAIKYTWVLPQLRAHFGSWTVVKTDDGMYDSLETVKRNVGTDFDLGAWHLAMWSRSDLIGGVGVKLYQVGEYNNLVPLILSGLKLHQNIPYSKWTHKGIRAMVDKPLADAMLATVPKLTNQEILEIRKDCLVVQSGAKKGQDRDPKTTAMLYGIPTYKKYDLTGIPKLALVMLAQIWCAHPANRTPFMVLDPEDWDRMPDPVISTDVIRTVPAFKKNDDFSWSIG